ncbi:ANTAR domain-containing protein [Streptomyces sp. NPDC006530]|uniref:ANTAR domain-containing protein n=1 Tax=Streptomyces sp. NPDC006530 TaxID=3364750 RepID=UPI0036979D88
MNERTPSETNEALHREIEQLRRAMETRPAIDLARGALMASFRLSPQDAWTVLVTVSQHTNSKLHQVAEDVLGSINGEPLPQALQQQLAAALAPFRAKPPTPPRPADLPAGSPDDALHPLPQPLDPRP